MQDNLKTKKRLPGLRFIPNNSALKQNLLCFVFPTIRSPLVTTPRIAFASLFLSLFPKKIYKKNWQHIPLSLHVIQRYSV